MTTITFVKREITYLLVALNTYQSKLREAVGEEMGDEYEDLLMTEHLIKRIKEAEAASEAESESEFKAGNDAKAEIGGL